MSTSGASTSPAPEGTPGGGPSRPVEGPRDGGPGRPSRPWIQPRRAIVVSGALLALFLVIWFGVLPYPWTLRERNPEVTALMEQRIEEARAAGDSLEIHQEWVPLDRISPEIVRAVIVAEDHRFRQHEGVDWQALAEEVRWTGDDEFQWWSPSDLWALARAVGYVWENRSELRGRSTITQQLAKNLYFGTERSLLRKVMELVVARRLERRLGKDRILELYLNVAELGPGLFGVEAASQAYFGRSASSLGSGSGAELAATLPHPLTSNPARNPRRMLWRKELILRRLAAPPGAPPGPLPFPDFDVEPPDLGALDADSPALEEPDGDSTGMVSEPSFTDSVSMDSTSRGIGGAEPEDGIPPEDGTGLEGEAPGGGDARVRDPVRSVSELARAIESCRERCAGVVYLWSERMPLSLAGADQVVRAAGEIGIEPTLMEAEDLAAYAAGKSLGGVSRSEDRVGRAVLASGALAHAPALVVHSDGRVVGPAIFGYKTSAAYASAIRRRLGRAGRGEGVEPTGRTGNSRTAKAARRRPGAVEDARRLEAPFQTVAELEAVGRPGAYFRWVPGREAIAYESGGRIYLLDLGDGRSREAPGYVDFVPTPDGRLFVTPAPRRSGMAFYDADQVFEGTEEGEPGRVEAFFTDPAMRDQYPSVGILRQGEDPRRPETRTTYRVLTSWFEGVSYRDYRITGPSREGGADLRPLGEPVEPCGDRRLSIPIMSQSGREVAARDESTGTTKIFRIREGGRCDEVLDLGVHTGKVAWHWSGRLLAFARPPTNRRIGPGGAFRGPPGIGGGGGGAESDGDTGAADGIFLYDRDGERMWRVPGSRDASALAFPEFIGDDRLVYLVPGDFGEPSVFRVVDGPW